MERDWRMVGDVEDTVEEAISTAPGLKAMAAATTITQPMHAAIQSCPFSSLYLKAYVDRWLGATAGEFNQQPVLNRAVVLLLWDAYQKPL